MQNIEYAGYGAFYRKEDSESKTSERAITAESSDIVESKIINPSSSYFNTLNNHNNDFDLEGEVAKGIWHFYLHLKSFYELCLFCDIAPDIFSSGYFKNNIADYAKNNFTVVKTVDDVDIYGMDGASWSSINRRIDRWKEISRGFSTLPPALLLSLVAAYDSAFSEFCKTLLKARPERYNGSDKKVSVSEILSLNSMDQFIDKIIQDELDQTMRKSHKEQIEYFESMFNVKVREKYKKWNNYLEIFERRNLAAHGDLTVNEIYLNNTKDIQRKRSVELGEKLDIDSLYFEESIDILIEFGLIAALSAWRKLFPAEQDKTFAALIEISYNLLLGDHPSVALNVLEQAIKEGERSATEEQRKMMIINFAIANKMVGNNEICADVLNTTDWSLCGPHFHLCKHSILENCDEAIKYIESSHNSNLINIQVLRDWPAFKWIRKNEVFRSEAERVFLEPLFPSRMVTSTGGDGSDPEGLSKLDEGD